MPQGTESTAKFKADISQLKSAMQEASRQVRLANSEFKAATAGMDNWSKSADGLSAKVKQLGSVLGAQKSKLSSLEKQYELVAKEEGESSKGAQELAIKINNQKAIVGKTEAELSKYEKELVDCKNSTGKFDTSLEQTNKDTKKASDGFTVMKGALASLVADGIKLAITGLKNLGREAVEAYKEFDTGRDNVIKATGATGKAADDLVKSYSNVSKTVKGEFSSIGGVLGEINTRFEFTGKQLENSTADFLKFAEITGTEPVEAVRLVSRAMKDAGIDNKNYKKVLDQLTTASQKSGIQVSNLAETLAKYGAPMRALGFDTKESIALFSAWEKAGVNTSIAFSGLKKAISNWGKANKDPKEEFKKTLEEIKSTPSIAKATTKAIEVFGSKAGPDLADAIKQGRFEYSDFVKYLDNSKDSVKKTYAATKDGFDKTELAIQNARLELGKFISNLVDKYQPQIENGIKSVTNFIKSAFKFIADNGNEIKAVIAGLIAAFAVSKIIAFTTAIISAVGTIKTLITTIKAATTAQEAFNAVGSASPWGLIAGLVGAAVGAIVLFASSTDDATSAAEKNRKSLDELSSSYKDLEKNRNESNSSINAEYDHLADLKKEYNSYVDDQGKIKKKYQERANFILNQLADAMGVERSEIDKTIEKNGKLGKSIDNLMLKQKAQAVLEANKEAYAEAVKNQIDAQNVLITKQKELNDLEAQYASGNYSERGVGSYTFENKIKNKKQEVEEAERVLAGYQSTLTNFENLSAAISSGSAKAIKQSLINIQNGFISAQTGTGAALKQQVNSFKKNYEDLKTAVKEGYAGVSQEDVNAAKKLVERSKTELSKWITNSSEIAQKAKKAGLSIPKNIASGIVNGSITVEQATDKVEQAIKFKKMVKNADTATKKAVDAIVHNYLAGKTSAKDAAGEVAAAAIKGLKKEEKGNSPEDAGKNFLTGYLTGLQNKNLITKVNDQGLYIGQTAVKNLNKGQKSKSPSKATEKSGIYYGEGYLKGIKSMTKKILAAAYSVGTGATDALAEAQQEGSPSKITYNSGVNFVKGFINGIVSEKNILVRTVKGLITSATTELLNLNNFNFSEVSNKALNAFSNAFSKKLSYTNDKISYENEKKLKEFDTTISSLQAEQKKKEDLQSKKSKAKSKLETAKDKKKNALENIKELEHQKKLSAAEKKRLKKLKGDVSDYNKEISKQKKIISSTSKSLKKYDANYKKLISSQEKAKEAYSNASSKMLEELSTALNEYQSKAEDLVNNTINGITETYQARYDALVSKQDNLIDKLKEAEDLFTVSSAGVLTVNDINQQTQAIINYADGLEEIRQKVSSGLFDKILSYDMEQGQAFISQLLSLSEEELKAYSDAYDKKMMVAENIGKSLFLTDFDDVANDYKKAIKDAMADLPKQLEDLGKDVMAGFVTGLTEDTSYITGSVKTLINGIIDTFKKELDIHSPSGVTENIGELTGSGFVNGLLNMVNKAKEATRELIAASSRPLESFNADIILAKQGVGSGTGANAGTVITNNYNMVQNNTSPKSLSALDTYKARQQQLAMLKAATSSL